MLQSSLHRQASPTIIQLALAAITLALLPFLLLAAGTHGQDPAYYLVVVPIGIAELIGIAHLLVPSLILLVFLVFCLCLAVVHAVRSLIRKRIPIASLAYIAMYAGSALLMDRVYGHLF